MKLALSIAGVRDVDAPTLAQRVKEGGMDAVEINSQGQGTSTLPEILELGAELLTFGVAICCVAYAVPYFGAVKDRSRAEEIKAWLDVAAEMQAVLRLVESPQGNTGSEGYSLQEFGDWLGPLGDYAVVADVKIAVQNGPTIRHARQMWALLDRLNHPMVGCCWDLPTALAAGEQPGVSVPILNSRIFHARAGAVAELLTGKSEEAGLTVSQMIHRLRGIGYGGHLAAETIADGAERSTL